MQFFVLLAIVLSATCVSGKMFDPPHAARHAAPGVNEDTMALIKKYEGFVSSPAPDPIGLPTVGYGHLCTSPNCAEVPKSFPFTKADGTKLLVSDLKPFQETLTRILDQDVQARLNPNEKGALLSWMYNVGSGNARKSSLISRLNAGENPQTVVAEELPRWNKAGGKVLQGLVNRREAEVRAFMKPYSPED